MIIKDYLHLIDRAKDKTVLQTLGFAYGEREISARIYNTSFGGGGCGVYGCMGPQTIASNRSVEISLLS